jgi:hypothetical protein
MAHSTADLYQGLMNTTLRLGFDKTMSYLFKDRWGEIKRDTAFSNAREEMDKAEFTMKDYKVIKQVKQPVEVENY